MNIAFSGLILLLIFLPGIIFRISIIKSDSFENPLDASRTAEFVFIFVPGIIMQALGYWFLESILGYDVALDQLYYLISGNSKSIESLDFARVIEPSFISFLKYILFLCVLALIAGTILKKIILYFYLDLKHSSILSITNEWDNLLSGRDYIYRERYLISELRKEYIAKENLSVLFSSYKRKKLKVFKRQLKRIKVDYIDIPILATFGGQNILYQGTLQDFFLATGNSIDKIYLISAMKRKLEDEDKEFQLITSDTIVLKNENIVNLNVRIVLLEY